MQGYWNTVSSYLQQKLKTSNEPKNLSSIQALYVPASITQQEKDTIVQSNDIITTRNNVSTAHLHVNREDCLARTYQEQSIVVWYSKKAQLAKLIEEKNERASLLTNDPFYGNVIITGVFQNKNYLAYPIEIRDLLAQPKEEPPEKRMRLAPEEQKKEKEEEEEKEKIVVEEVVVFAKKKAPSKSRERGKRKRTKSKRKRNQYY